MYYGIKCKYIKGYLIDIRVRSGFVLMVLKI